MSSMNWNNLLCCVLVLALSLTSCSPLSEEDGTKDPAPDDGLELLALREGAVELMRSTRSSPVVVVDVTADGELMAVLLRDGPLSHEDLLGGSLTYVLVSEDGGASWRRYDYEKGEVSFALGLHTARGKLYLLEAQGREGGLVEVRGLDLATGELSRGPTIPAWSASHLYFDQDTIASYLAGTHGYLGGHFDTSTQSVAFSVSGVTDGTCTAFHPIGANDWEAHCETVATRCKERVQLEADTRERHCIPRQEWPVPWHTIQQSRVLDGELWQTYYDDGRSWATRFDPATGQPTAPLDLGTGTLDDDVMFWGFVRHALGDLVLLRAQPPRMAEHAEWLDARLVTIRSGVAQEVTLPNLPCINGDPCGTEQAQKFDRLRFAFPLGEGRYLMVWHLGRYGESVQRIVARVSSDGEGTAASPSLFTRDGRHYGTPPVYIAESALERMCARAKACFPNNNRAMRHCVHEWLHDVGEEVEHNAAYEAFLATPYDEQGCAAFQVTYPALALLGSRPECPSRCDGDAWLHCEQGQVFNCRASGQHCVEDADGARCEAPVCESARPAACSDRDHYGSCHGREVCTRAEMECAQDGCQTRYFPWWSCRSGNAVRCEENHLLYCLGGAQRAIDCGELGFSGCREIDVERGVCSND